MSIGFAVRAGRVATTLPVARRIAMPALAWPARPAPIFPDPHTSQMRALEKNPGLAPFILKVISARIVTMPSTVAFLARTRIRAAKVKKRPANRIQ